MKNEKVHYTSCVQCGRKYLCPNVEYETICSECVAENRISEETVEGIHALGHTYHCAYRQVWGDGECECDVKIKTWERTMSTAYKCNRCGKYFDELPNCNDLCINESNKAYRGGLEVKMIYHFHFSEYGKDEELDICPECDIELINKMVERFR